MANTGKNLYKCEDCGEQRYLYSYIFSRRSGNVCMCCGGRLEPKSQNADIKDGERGDRLEMPTTGSLVRCKKLYR